jgi:hypothetical protein
MYAVLDASAVHKPDSRKTSACDLGIGAVWRAILTTRKHGAVRLTQTVSCWFWLRLASAYQAARNKCVGGASCQPPQRRAWRRATNALLHANNGRDGPHSWKSCCMWAAVDAVHSSLPHCIQQACQALPDMPVCLGQLQPRVVTWLDNPLMQ